MLLLYGNTICPTDWQVTEQQAPGYSRVYCIYSGSVTYADSLKTVQLQKDHIYIFPSSEPYSMKHDPKEPLHCTYLHYDFFPVQGRRLIEIKIADHRVMGHLFSALAQSIHEDHRAVVESIVQAIVLYSRRKQLLDPVQSPIAEALNYIRHNYMENLNNEALSRVLGYNPQYFIRLFRKYAGMTPHQYLINYRILEAKKLLKTEKSIIEIADLCGFSDAKSFGRSFRNKQGVSPTQFRETQQQP
jgi:AraC-like DNA-binding protein